MTAAAAPDVHTSVINTAVKWLVSQSVPGCISFQTSPLAV